MFEAMVVSRMKRGVVVVKWLINLMIGRLKLRRSREKKVDEVFVIGTKVLVTFMGAGSLPSTFDCYTRASYKIEAHKGPF